MTTPYVTPLDAVVIPRAVRMGDIWVTHHALEDPDGPGLAHLHLDALLELAERVGARLLTAEEIYALHLVAAAAGTELHPVTLPNAAMRREGCVPGDARMVTREWCDVHDAAVLAQMAALTEAAPDAPIANDGKYWRGGAPAGLAGLCGWWVPRVELYDPHRHGPGFVQQGGAWPHNRRHSDYGSMGRFAWDCDPGWSVAGKAWV